MNTEQESIILAILVNIDVIKDYFDIIGINQSINQMNFYSASIPDKVRLNGAPAKTESRIQNP